MRALIHSAPDATAQTVEEYITDMLDGLVDMAGKAGLTLLVTDLQEVRDRHAPRRETAPASLYC